MSARARACFEEAIKALLYAIEDLMIFGAAVLLCLCFATIDAWRWIGGYAAR